MPGAALLALTLLGDEEGVLGADGIDIDGLVGNRDTFPGAMVGCLLFTLYHQAGCEGVTEGCSKGDEGTDIEGEVGNLVDVFVPLGERLEFTVLGAEEVRLAVGVTAGIEGAEGIDIEGAEGNAVDEFTVPGATLLELGDFEGR